MAKNHRWLFLPPAVALLLVLGPLSMSGGGKDEPARRPPSARENTAAREGMATRDGAAIQVLVWNYHDDVVSAAATPVHLAINLPASFGSRARVSHLRVDEVHGDAYSTWVAQGMPTSPSAAQVAVLQQAMHPALLVPDVTVAVAADGSIGVDFDLPRFAVSLVTVVPGDG